MHSSLSSRPAVSRPPLGGIGLGLRRGVARGTSSPFRPPMHVNPRIHTSRAQFAARSRTIGVNVVAQAANRVGQVRALGD